MELLWKMVVIMNLSGWPDKLNYSYYRSNFMVTYPDYPNHSYYRSKWSQLLCTAMASCVCHRLIICKLPGQLGTIRMVLGRIWRIACACVVSLASLQGIAWGVNVKFLMPQLTYWGVNKMAAILQKTSPNILCWQTVFDKTFTDVCS